MKYFGQARDVKQGISLGMKTILAAKSVILMASGEKKAAIVARTLRSDIDASIPATLLKNHPQVQMLVDKPAATLL
ncbi:Glucosamine-6-phosphate deaminase [compost metagenome]